MAGSRRRRPSGEHDNDDRWLLTYADMITLLMALFMVLFSISSVNISKYRTLQRALKAAFSGAILSGGKAIMQSGSSSSATQQPSATAVPSIQPLSPTTPAALGLAGSSSSSQVSAAIASAAATAQEQAGFEHLKQELDAYAQSHGFGNQVQTQIERQGLVVRVLTDQLLFDSGQAELKPQGYPLLNEVASLLNVDETHPIIVEGHTDNQPISTAQFPSNWELSTARATTVVRYLISRGVAGSRLGAAGYADLHPIASNATARGRQLNRRVEILLMRLNPPPT